MPSRGTTISVTAETNSGGRRHMEDYLAVKLCPNESLREVPELREQAYIAVFDGHGGKEAAKFAREKLWDAIQDQPKFMCSDSESVCQSISDAFESLHTEMLGHRGTWKPNKMGDPSTAGTTVSTVIFRQDKIFVANVGDSTAILAVRNPSAHMPGEPAVLARVLTKDHKPEDPEETQLVESLGGRVMVSKKGVPRVVWERRRSRTSTDSERDDEIDLIPFLSVSRSLGDFWSYNPRTDKYTVSPRPYVNVLPLDLSEQKFVVIASDGLWNVMSPSEVVEFIWNYEQNDQQCHELKDVVRSLINEALSRWRCRHLLADNIAVLIAFLSEESPVETAPLSGVGMSSHPTEDVLTTTLSSGSPPGEDEGIAVDSPPEEKPSEFTEPKVEHVTNSRSGSHYYYKETLPEGVTIEYETKIRLRHRRKEKYRTRTPRGVAARKSRLGISTTGDSEVPGPSSGWKRRRGEGEGIASLETAPDSKRTRMEVTSSDLGSPEGIISDTSGSSGVYSDTSTPDGTNDPALPFGCIPVPVDQIVPDESATMA